ncbi:peptidoglycan-binding protein [Streptomyces sp. NPDC051218]|uniref:peptidoglycan-binding protein n=1 Tax=Streptomyces sp. NPDC051218 TaxID=3365645 RepID=UPI003788A8C5
MVDRALSTPCRRSYQAHQESDLMTGSYYCCPDCGADLTALPDAMCTCAGPFTEDQADPMHIRPYLHQLPQCQSATPVEPDAGWTSREGTPTASRPLAVHAHRDDHDDASTAPDVRHSTQRGKPRARSASFVRITTGFGVIALLALATLQAWPDGTSDTQSGAFPRDSSATEPTHHSPSTDSPTPGSASPSPSESRRDHAHQPKSHPSPARDSPGTGEAVDPAPILRPGDTGPEVVELQQRLKECEFLAQSSPEDSGFTPLVHEAVFRFQVARGIHGDPNGQYGAATRSKLEGETRS